MAAEREFILSRIALGTAETRRVEEVIRERFSAIEGTFSSNALALTAALAAQKEAAAEQNKSNSTAIDKSEEATKETIAANAAQTSAGLSSQAAIVADLKERVVRLETAGPVRLEERSERRLDRGVSMATLMAVIAVVSVVAAIALGLAAALR
jgi:Tfp pilus assembly protein PilE